MLWGVHVGSVLCFCCFFLENRNFYSKETEQSRRHKERRKQGAKSSSPQHTRGKKKQDKQFSNSFYRIVFILVFEGILTTDS